MTQFIEIYPQQEPRKSSVIDVCSSTDLEALNRRLLGPASYANPSQRARARHLLSHGWPETLTSKYTQYMPARCIQPKDMGLARPGERGPHLEGRKFVGIGMSVGGSGRRARRLVSAGSYGFHRSLHTLEPGLIQLLVPGHRIR